MKSAIGDSVNAWSAAIGHGWKRRPACASPSCPGMRSVWHRLRRRHSGTFLQGAYYCQSECLETALIAQLTSLRRLTPALPSASRIPLGLLMVARGTLTYAEVVAALEAQRRAQHGTIGEWLETLGFASEEEVTSALGLQWGCPIASSLEGTPIPSHCYIPLSILEAFRMIPVQYATTTQTLHLACAQRVDHTALYAIEKIIGCRTQACVGGRKNIAQHLENLRQQPRLNELEFDRLRDVAEMSRIGVSYISRLAAEDARVVRVGPMIWLRLQVQSSYMSLVFHLREETQPQLRRIAAFFPVVAETKTPAIGQS